MKAPVVLLAVLAGFDFPRAARAERPDDRDDRHNPRSRHDWSKTERHDIPPRDGSPKFRHK